MTPLIAALALAASLLLAAPGHAEEIGAPAEAAPRAVPLTVAVQEADPAPASPQSTAPQIVEPQDAAPQVVTPQAATPEAAATEAAAPQTLAPPSPTPATMPTGASAPEIATPSLPAGASSLPAGARPAGTVPAAAPPASTVQSALTGPQADSQPVIAPNVVARINLSTQRMDVWVDGVQRHSWPVSTARKGYRTPLGTYRPERMHKRYFSRKYDNAPMPYSIFFHRGWAIHGTNDLRRLGRPASHGCVRLHPDNARALFALVSAYGRANTRIVISR